MYLWHEIRQKWANFPGEAAQTNNIQTHTNVYRDIQYYTSTTDDTEYTSYTYYTDYTSHTDYTEYTEYTSYTCNTDLYVYISFNTCILIPLHTLNKNIILAGWSMPIKAS